MSTYIFLEVNSSSHVRILSSTSCLGLINNCNCSQTLGTNVCFKSYLWELGQSGDVLQPFSQSDKSLEIPFN